MTLRVDSTGLAAEIDELAHALARLAQPAAG
jgi:hypothetical protein